MHDGERKWGRPWTYKICFNDGWAITRARESPSGLNMHDGVELDVTMKLNGQSTGETKLSPVGGGLREVHEEEWNMILQSGQIS